MPTFKVVIVGDVCTGKTCLLKRYINDTFDKGEGNTLGSQLYSKKLTARFMPKADKANEDAKSQRSTVSSSKQLEGMITEDIKLQLWDTAGEERFMSLTPMYYKDAQAVLLVFALNSQESFENLQGWIREIDLNCQTSNYILALVGTKLDLDDQKEVAFKQGQQHAKSNNAIYFETSAKEGTNIKEMF